MNKFGVVLGFAAVAVIAGCKDPDFNRGGSSAAQNDVKRVDTAPAPVSSDPVVIIPVEPAPAPAPAPVAAKPARQPAPVVAAEPETTVYIVQRGDYLAKISKKFNVTIASIRKLNNMKSDVVRVGQKIKLPGKVDVGDQKSPAAAPAPKAAAKKATSYSGETKEYVVKNGDTLGSVAYGNGINIRQLKELNGLSTDKLRIGQKLKIPASGKAPAAKAAPALAKEKQKATGAVSAAEAKSEAVASVATAKKEEAPVAEPVASPATNEPAAVADESAPSASSAEGASEKVFTTYVVQEGDDMTGISIRFNVTAAEIRELNNLQEGDPLPAGKVLKIPAADQQ